MTTKYRGLPDVDTAPDVFETADEPESLLRPNEGGFGDEDIGVKPSSENIDSAQLPLRQNARKVFRSRRDQSGYRLPTLSTRNQRSSSFSSSDSEPSHGSRPRELPQARLRRLKAELAEVEREIKAGPSTEGAAASGIGGEGGGGGGKRKSVLPPRPTVDLMAELSTMRGTIDSLERDGEGLTAGSSSTGQGWEDKLRKLSTKEVGERNSTEKNGEQAAQLASSRTFLSDLDKRLASLEDLIGPIPHSSSSLLPTVDKLDHLLSLLAQPRHLDAISRRVKLLLVDLDRAAAASRRTGPSSQPLEKSSTVTLSQTEYESLLSLFSILPRLDSLLPIFPPLLNRLQSLSTLHSEAAEVTDSLRRLQSEDKSNSEELGHLRSVVEDIQKGLSEAGQGVEKNWKGLEERMGNLEKRLEGLK